MTCYSQPLEVIFFEKIRAISKGDAQMIKTIFCTATGKACPMPVGNLISQEEGEGSNPGQNEGGETEFEGGDKEDG